MAESCVVFTKYDKISDDLMYLGKGALVKFNVALAYKDRNGCRRSYHNEYQYESKKYNNVTSDLRTIRRKFDYYISIDINGDFDSSIMICPKDMIILRSTINNVAKWFTGGKVFGQDKQGNIHIVKEPNKMYIRNLNNKYIAFAPAVARYDNGTQKEAARLFINSDEVFVDVNIDTFMEFAYLMSSIDMYQCAIGLINYLGRPEFGYNLMAFEPSRDINPYLEQDMDASSGATIRRSITAEEQLKEKCAFDEIDEL